MLAKFVVALVQLAIRIMGNSKAFKKAMEALPECSNDTAALHVPRVRSWCDLLVRRVHSGEI